MRPQHEWSPTAAALVLGTLWGFAAIGTSATSVVLGDLRTDLGLTVPAVSWVLTVFAVAFAAATPVFGRLADSFGPRRPYMVGTVLLATGAVIAALAPNLPALLAGRAVQGLGAGAIPVLSTAVLSIRYVGRDRAVALGRINSAVLILGSLGPVIGGVLGTVGSWRWPFALPAVTLLLLPLAYRLAPHGGTGAHLDLIGAALVAGTAVTGLVLLQTVARPAPSTLVTASALAVLAGVLWHHTRRHPHGFLPQSLLRNRRVIGVCLAAAAMPLVYFGVLIALPLELHERGWSVLANGLLLLPGAVVGSVTSFYSASFVARWGRIRTAELGLTLSLVGSVLVALVGVHPALAGLGFIGLATGYSMAQPTLVGEVSASVPDDLRGGALGIFNLIFFLGAGVGAAVIGGFGEVLSLRGAVLVTALGPLLAVLILRRMQASPPLRRSPLDPAS